MLLDYAHNAAGLEAVGDFVERMTSDVQGGEQPGAASWTANLRVAVVATAGDRRDEDMHELGRVAARYFDEVIIREDRNPRGRPRGRDGRADPGGRPTSAIGGGSPRRATSRSSWTRWRRPGGRSTARDPGDLVVLCVDYATEVFKEIESRRGSASPQVLLASEGDGHVEAVGGDPDLLGV